MNPLLRRAVAGAVEIRNHHFKRMREVTERARDEVERSILVVSAVSILALLLSVAVVLHLARAIVWPLRALGASAQAMRRGDFDRRTPVLSNDELGRLADTMNRMAAELAEVRRTNIREVIQAKQTLEATIAALPDAILVVDSTGVVSSANQAASALLNPGAADGARSIDDILLHPKTRAAFHQALTGQVGDEHELSPHAAVSLQVAGEVRHFVPRVVPIGAGTPEASGAVLVLNDVTEFVRLSERRGELVAVTSHELRTPLTTLRMTLMMLREGSVNIGRRGDELVAAAVHGVDQLVGIVDEFLDLARIEAGELRLSYGRVDLGELAADVGRVFAHRCEEVGVALRIERPKNRVEVWGDSPRLRAVLANLIDNAVKYTPRGGTIRVRTGLHMASRAASMPPRAEVMVSDTGPGVRPEFRDRIFEKFFRVEQLKPEGDRGVRGSGIGLYLARQIVEAHAGTIACVPGGKEGGAHIGFVLPVEPPRAASES